MGIAAMSKQALDTFNAAAPALADDLRRILGALDSDKAVAIMALRPTIMDVEEASLWLAGDTDVFGAGKPLNPVAGKVVDILTADEDEEPRSPA
jgi:hypothetical protein